MATTTPAQRAAIALVVADKKDAFLAAGGLGLVMDPATGILSFDDQNRADEYKSKLDAIIEINPSVAGIITPSTSGKGFVLSDKIVSEEDVNKAMDALIAAAENIKLKYRNTERERSKVAKVMIKYVDDFYQDEGAEYPSSFNSDGNDEQIIPEIADFGIKKGNIVWFLEAIADKNLSKDGDLEVLKVMLGYNTDKGISDFDDRRIMVKGDSAWNKIMRDTDKEGELRSNNQIVFYRQLYLRAVFHKELSDEMRRIKALPETNEQERTDKKRALENLKFKKEGDRSAEGYRGAKLAKGKIDFKNIKIEERSKKRTPEISKASDFLPKLLNNRKEAFRTNVASLMLGPRIAMGKKRRAKAAEQEIGLTSKDQAATIIQKTFRGHLGRTKLLSKAKADKLARDAKKEEVARKEAEDKTKASAAAKASDASGSATQNPQSTWRKIITFPELKTFLKGKGYEGETVDGFISSLIGKEFIQADGSNHTGIELEEWGEASLIYQGPAGAALFNSVVNTLSPKWDEQNKTDSLGGSKGAAFLSSIVHLRDCDGNGTDMTCIVTASKRGLTTTYVAEEEYRAQISLKMQQRWELLRRDTYLVKGRELLLEKCKGLSGTEKAELETALAKMDLPGFDSAENEAKRKAIVNDPALKAKMADLLAKHGLTDEHKNKIGNGDEERHKVRERSAGLYEQRAEASATGLTANLTTDDVDKLKSGPIGSLGSAEEMESLLNSAPPLTPVGEDLGVGGVSVLRSKNNNRANVFFGKPIGRIDTMLLSIPGHADYGVRVRVAKEDGTMTRFVNGEIQNIEVRAGDVIIDEGTIFPYVNGKYDQTKPIKLDKKEFVSKRLQEAPNSLNKNKKQLKIYEQMAGRDFDNLSKVYNNFEVKAISDNGTQRGVAVLKGGRTASDCVSFVATNAVQKESDGKKFGAVEVGVNEDGTMYNPEDKANPKAPQERLFRVMLDGGEVIARLVTYFEDFTDTEDVEHKAGDMVFDPKPYVIAANGSLEEVELEDNEEFLKYRVATNVNLSGPGADKKSLPATYNNLNDNLSLEGEVKEFHEDRAYGSALAIFQNLKGNIASVEAEAAKKAKEVADKAAGTAAPPTATAATPPAAPKAGVTPPPTAPIDPADAAKIEDLKKEMEEQQKKVAEAREVIEKRPSPDCKPLGVRAFMADLPEIPRAVGGGSSR